MPALGYALVHRPKTMFAAFDRTPSWALVACLGLVVGVAGTKLDSSGSVIGHSAGQIVAVNTAWGGFPTTDDEIIKRATEMGATSRKLASGFKTVIFPEAVLGVREVGNFAVFKSEVLRRAARDGQVIVVGAYLDLGHGRLQNAALVFRPDGTNSEVIAKQTPPLATWNPTAKNGHVPANWLAKATTNIAPGINARIMLCYEEYIVFFHLLSEAREDQQIVVSIANRWASHDELSSIVQAAHTEGMARLFDRPWVRAENNALPTVTLHEFKY